MEKKEKKKYEKPKVMKVKLDPRTAVLGFCKASGSAGPAALNCGFPASPCSAQGS
jgi:hypothetical protein